MRNRGGLTLLRVLFILVVLCHTGFGLSCYSCVNPLAPCNSAINCSAEFDTCAIVVSGPRKYHQCWKKAECTAAIFSKSLSEPDLEYRCCQTNLCNLDLKEPEKDKEKGGTVTLSGKTMLVVPLVLVTSWNHFL